MMRFFLILFLILLSMLELGFVFALPFPLDRIPLVVAVCVFLYQSLDVRWSAWWVVFHGLFLDLLNTSSVALETLSFTVAALVLVLASRHLFSNRSFWGISGLFTLTLFALTCMEVLISVFQSIFQDFSLSIVSLVTIRLWALGFGMILLLCLFPVSELLIRIQKQLLSS